MVSRRYHWRCMKEDIPHFVKAWMKCQVNRASYQKQGGFLQPLPISSGPWHSIFMDLITSLPESHGYDAILLVIERFAKMGGLGQGVQTNLGHDQVVGGESSKVLRSASQCRKTQSGVWGGLKRCCWMWTTSPWERPFSKVHVQNWSSVFHCGTSVQGYI